MERPIYFVLAVLAGVLVITLSMALRGCGAPVGVPEPFVRAASPAELIDAAPKGRAVVAFFTADWCPPCQQLKAGALQSSSVQSWLRENADAVYVDSTNARQDSDQAAVLTRYRVQAFPTLVVFRDGKEVSRISGNVPARELLAWLESASPKPAS